MLIGCGLAALFTQLTLLMSMVATLLSIAYSVRIPGIKWRGKEIGGIDVLIDALGCGIVGIILGYSIGGAIPDERVWWISIAFTITVAGSYAATQIFQLKAVDTYQTARNFSTLFGAARALKFGALLLIIGFIMIHSLITFEYFHEVFNNFIGYFYLFFIFIFLYGVFQCLKWSKNPFQNSTPQFKSVIYTLLTARLFWIIAEWLRTT